MVLYKKKKIILISYRKDDTHEVGADTEKTKHSSMKRVLIQDRPCTHQLRGC